MTSDIKAQTLAYLCSANHAVVNAISQSREQLDDTIREKLHLIERTINEASAAVRIAK